MEQTGQTVILVNDSRTQLNVMARILRQQGLGVLDFESAEEALLAMQSGAQPDVIVTDLYMPGIDGWRLCRLLRSPEYLPFNRTPILVFSSTFSGEDAVRITAETGADGFLSLPDGMSRLERTVQAMIRGDFHLERPRVLIVEDGKTLAAILQQALEQHSYRTDVALTAGQAVDMFDAGAYDVALIDYHLPDSTGDLLLDDFREKRPGCVCIMMTVDQQPGLALECMKKGAAAYLRKPFDPEYLIDVCARARRERTLLRVEDRLEQRTRELRKSEERHRIVADNTRDWEYWILPDGCLEYCSPSCERITGYCAQDFLSDPGLIDRIVHPDDAGMWRDHLLQASRDFGHCHHDLRIIVRDGKEVWISHHSVAIFSDAGDYLGRRVSNRDISERVRHEMALKASEERADRQRRAIADLALDPSIASGDTEAFLMRLTETASSTMQVARASVWLLTGEGARLECVSLFEADSGRHGQGAVLTTGDFPRYFQALRTENRIFAEDARNDPRTRELAQGYLARLGITSMLDAGIMIQGELVGVVCQEHIGPMRKWHPDEESFVGALAGMAAQVFVQAEQRRAYEQLRKSEARSQALLRALPDMMFLFNSEGTFLDYHAPEAELLVPPELFLGRSVQDALPADLAKTTLSRIREVLGERNSVTYAYDAEIRGEIRSFETRMTPCEGDSVLAIVRDTTARKQAEAEQHRLEAQLRHAHKMEAVGALTGGIAHDFNNIIQAISGYAQRLLAGKSAGDPDCKGLNIIRQSCQRAGALIGKLLAFSRRMEVVLRPLNLNHEVLETQAILEQTFPRMIEVDMNLENGLWPVNSDPVQVQQILLNLCGNAADAMPEGGRLSIETGNMIVEERHDHGGYVIEPGRYVTLTVEDTGCGMSEEVRQKVFDPFFTTKDVGKGTGLGLASVYGIVKSLSGHITCSSAVGRGSCFTVHLPACADKPVQVPPDGMAESLLGGSETVLVVDDDEAIRELTAEALQEFGYSVLSAESGEKALQVYARQGARIDLVMMDLNMPGMGGRKCMEKLRATDQHVKVLIASGHAASSLGNNLLAAGASGFIGKPFQLKELAAKVREVLDG